VKRLHDLGYTFTERGTIDSLTPRQRALLNLAAQAETYIKQEQQRQQETAQETRGRPENFGDVEASRRDAFQ
jgi:hypothetical protein